MEYHRTHDILQVKKTIGYENIENVLIYTQLVNFECEDEFICNFAETVDEAK